jgi:REP element-mobilizing transposase RayT
MSQSLTQVYLHRVFSTKNRRPFLHDKALRDRSHAYLAGTCNNLHCPAEIVGGVQDHVHILCRFGKEIALAELIRELKRESSKWLKEQDKELESFYWQNGYGAFSVSPAHVPALKQYIATQEDHHRTETFQEEFRRLLSKYGIAWDERYVWD